MEKLNTLENEWTKMLASREDGEVLTALHQIRNSGSVRMLDSVIGLLDKTPKAKLADHILEFIGEIREQEAVPELMEWLGRMEKTRFFSGFLAACWQTGLDFSGHLLKIANVFVRSDYQTSVEAFTLIEESLHLASEDIKLECLRQLREDNERIEREKYPLYLELIRTIQAA